MARESRIQREIKQGRPFRSRSQEATVALLRTADMVRREIGRVVETHGITLQQFNVLRILRGAGDAGLPTLEIAARMVEETPGITRLLDRLEKKGLVRRKRCATDRRQVLCWITAPGLTLLAGLDQPILAGDSSVLGALEASDVDALIRCLDAVRAGIEAQRTHSK
jgi:MarR family transcriptional regulator, organic hydroperoxide resistance regulator